MPSETASFNTSLVDNLGNMSMVSFNMDSVSQLGLGEVGDSFHDGVGLDLGQIKQQLQSRETKIKSLITDKKKLKSLLIKAKGAIDDINTKYRISEANLQQARS